MNFDPIVANFSLKFGSSYTFRINSCFRSKTPIFLNILVQMGCEQSDIAAFTNILNDNEQPPPQPQKQQPRNPPQQQNPFVQPQQYQQTPQPYQQPYQQPAQPYQQPAMNYPQAPAVQAVKVGASKPGDSPKKRKQPREHLDFMANFHDDFLTHHLKYELSLSKYSSTKRIKRRQVLQHIMLQNYWGNVGGAGINSQAYFESLISSWMQRTFMDIWEEAHDEFFNQHLEEKVVRRKIAEQYMFEIYELKEYVDSGLGNLNALVDKTRCSLTEFMQFSDDALFSLFKRLKDRYPQTGATEKIKFPDVPSTKTNINLLDHFASKCFLDPEHINIQTIFSDLDFMMSKAIEEQQEFKADMKEILGEDVLACPKVMQVNKDGKSEFNACAVRRVFIKWAENLLEKCPDLQMSKAFTNFVKTKFKITDNFFFKSTVQATTHKHVIDSISYLLDVAKYSLDTNEKRKEFIFNIYDLLRCKIKRNSAELVVELLKKMQSTKVTKSGRKFQVIRVKNRFETNNRDLLINFRYGDILIGQAQLCIDDANVSKLTKLNYEFCHYIYELERSLFGPTLELMMQYEDHQRPDISVDFAAEDMVQKRGKEKIKAAEKTDRKCLQGHEMISLVGNYFFGDDVDAAVSASCNYCDRMTTSDVRYDYCFHCGCFLCRECTQDYKKANLKDAWLSVQRDELATALKDEAHLRAECATNKSLIVVFHCDDIAPSQVFKDAILYHQSKLAMQLNKTLSKIAVANYSVAGVKNLCGKLQIKEFPTTILFNSSAAAVRTIIGASWLEVPFLYETHRRLIKGESIELPLNCAACQETMSFTQLPEDQALVCLNCFNNATPLSLPAQYHTVGAFCGQGHYRCIQCSYTALDIPSVYQDPTGTNYLSSSFTTPKLQKCPRGHATKYTKTNLLQTWEYECFSCRQKKMFDNENGMAVCETCKVGQCPKCLGCALPTFQELENGKDLALHFAESTAEEGCECACGRHFKKVYKTRNLSIEEMNEKNENETSSTWTCTLCQKTGKDGQLHIACFNCPTLSEIMGKKYNFEICLTCATVSQILQRNKKAKVDEMLSFFVCQKGHQMVKTSLSYKSDLSYNCMFCKTKYYANTERLHCKTCSTNCCHNCLEMLYNANPPRCNQLCPQGHNLKLMYKVDTLKFCDGCMKVIKDEYFDCAENGYSLCMACASRPPGFIGTAFADCKKGLLKEKGLLPEDFNEEAGTYEEDQQQGQNYNWGQQEEEASEGVDFGLDMDMDFF